MPKKRRPSSTTPSRPRRRPPAPPRSPLDRLMDQLTDMAYDTIDQAVDKIQTAWMNQHQTPIPGSGPQSRTRTQPPPPPPPPPRQRPTTKPSPSLYNQLQVSPYADAETITAAYRSLAKRFHPDNLQTGSKVRMQEIVAAYEVLSNVTRRKIYDRTIGL